MKKLLFVLGIGIAINAAAQGPSRFSIGPTVGASHAFLIPYKSWQFNPQWTAGLSWIYSPYEHFGLGGDVRYSAEGGKLNLEPGTTTIRLDYLRVPIKAMYFFNGVEDNIRPKVTLGPSVGFLVDELNTEPVPANKVDFGVNASAGFNYRMMENLWLNVDVNYYQGLIKIREAGSTKELNGNLGLQLGVLVGL
jgi:hypothetical protein